ncbi:MAG TPA: hypothetical protein VG346_04270 [Acidimicrobiales bacterium]|nr:hypothetical protein [Acidimicrobiales bacterium]
MSPWLERPAFMWASEWIRTLLLELDVKTDRVNDSAYQPAKPNGPAIPVNGAQLLVGMTGNSFGL